MSLYVLTQPNKFTIQNGQPFFCRQESTMLLYTSTTLRLANKYKKKVKFIPNKIAVIILLLITSWNPGDYFTTPPTAVSHTIFSCKLCTGPWVTSK